MMKPSEHEQGIWNGLLSIFRFEKKRQSITGLPSNLLGDLEARARPGETLALGVPHDLPRPNSPAALHLEIPAADASSSLLKPNVLGSGRRGSRSIPGISPRGSTPDGAETAEEQRLRVYAQLEASDEADFNANSRKSTQLQGLPDGADGAGPSSERKGSLSDRRSAKPGSPGSPMSTAADSSDDESNSSFKASRKSRSSRGDMASPPQLEGEAVPMFKEGGSPDNKVERRPAQERVFGQRPSPSKLQRASSVYQEEDQARRSTIAEAESTSAKAAARAAAQKQYEALLTEFDKANEEWLALQRGCSPPSKSAPGPRLKMPPSEAEIKNLIAAYTQPKPATLHQRYLLDLLVAIKRLWEVPPPGYVGQHARSVIDLADPPEGSRLILVGDTHGQLADVLWIFAEYGTPSPTNIYLFNGDVADRGAHAVEIFTLIFSYMLLYPGSIYLSRGNHENMEINERAQCYGGGFAEEVRSKYEPEVFSLFTSLFELLPLAFVVAEKALVIHGGIWRHRGVTLKQLRNLDHRRQCPEAPQTYDDYIFFDLLWSDPHPEDGDGVHESTRGDGCILFGRDMTVEFLRRNSLQLIVRSHQLPSDGHGYEVLHDGRCITVFSASNYGGSCYNAGAILVWERGEIDAHEFIAPNLEAQHKALQEEGGFEALLRRFSSRGSEWEEEVGCAAEPPHVARLDGEIARMIKGKVCRNRHALASEFARLDSKKSGCVSVDHWGVALGSVLAIDVPWKNYQPWLAELNESNEIDYRAFLARYEVRLKEEYGGWQRTVLQMFYNSLLAADLQISELLGFFDQDGDGMVSVQECTKALSSLELGLSRQQIQQLVLILGFDAAGPTPSKEAQIDLEAYLKRLALVADHTVIARSEQEMLDLQQIATWINDLAKKTNKSLSVLFKSWDENSDGYIDYEEFVNCLFTCQEQLYLADPTSLEYIYTREEFDELARTIDQAKTGRINYLSFLGLFSAAEMAAGQGVSPLLSRTTPASVFIEQICATIWANDVVLSRAFRSFDPKGTSTIAPAQFKSALEAMNSAVASPYSPITPAQIQQLVASLPLEASGMINYKDFMAAFEVRDKLNDA